MLDLFDPDDGSLPPDPRPDLGWACAYTFGQYKQIRWMLGVLPTDDKAINDWLYTNGIGYVHPWGDDRTDVKWLTPLGDGRYLWQTNDVPSMSGDGNGSTAAEVA